MPKIWSLPRRSMYLTISSMTEMFMCVYSGSAISRPRRVQPRPEVRDLSTKPWNCVAIVRRQAAGLAGEAHVEAWPRRESPLRLTDGAGATARSGVRQLLLDFGEGVGDFGGLAADTKLLAQFRQLQQAAHHLPGACVFDHQRMLAAACPER